MPDRHLIWRQSAHDLGPGARALREDLRQLQRPLPWRLDEDNPGVVLAADGSLVCTVDQHRELPDAQAFRLAMAIMVTANSAAGLEAAHVAVTQEPGHG